MDIYRYFENLINEAIQNDKDNDLMPREYNIEATANGWEIFDRNTNEMLYIELSAFN